MEAKQVKNHLKDAREAIRKKEYDVAIKHAEEVLTYDEANYNALVFLGAAAQELNEFEKAEKSFKKAVTVQPNQILAWQGWCMFCEKSSNPNHKLELMIIYEKLIDLQNDVDKKFELTSKLAQLHLERKDYEKTLQVLKSQYEFVTDNDEKKRKIDQAIVKVISSEEIISKENESLMKSALINIFSVGDEFELEDRKLYLMEYIKLLLKENNNQLCLTESQKLINLDPQLIYPYEVICTLYINAVARKEETNIAEIEQHVEKLFSLDSNNHVAKIAQITVKYSNNNKEALMVLLEQIELEKTIDECLILLRASELIHQYEKSIHFASLGLKYCAKTSIDNTIHRFQFQLGLISAQLQISSNETIEKNISILETLFSNYKSDVEVCKLLFLSYIKVDKLVDAKKLCCNESLWKGNTDLMDGYLGAILRRQNELIMAHTKLEIAVKKFPTDSFLMMELALTLRQLNDLPNSLLHLLTALKIDSYNPDLFFEIGNHYLLLKDLPKCQRCYKKSFAINPNNNTVAIALSDLYAQMGLETENLHLLTTITSNNNKWALIRLGFCHYTQENLTAAIKSLQKALSLDNKDSHCWEYLADCYMKRGSYTAALKSYTRALELNPESIYCYYQMAEISQLLQDYDTAVKEYRIILDKDPTYIPALKGYGMVKLLQANYYFQQCLPGLTRDCCAEAIETFSKAILLQPDLSCLWKLFGDACTIIHKIPTELCTFKIPEEFLRKGGIQDKSLNKLQLFDLGLKCYKQALSLNQSDNLWYDIAQNYYYQAWSLKGEDEKEILYNNSLLAMKKAVTLNSQNFAHWNALGIIAVRLKNFALAQHAFINSIKVENNNPDAWTNLGMIYLMHKNIELAHKAFSTAQTLDPSHIKCWIGMAIIAEEIGHLEAMDLFRHTTSLGYHEQSALGYAHWVVKVLLDDKIDSVGKIKFWHENMASLPTPSDCLVKYTGHVLNDAQAFNTLGILLEREKLYLQACDAFEKALSLLGNIENITQLDFVRSNYARVLCHRGKYKESTEQFLMVKNPDFYSQCGLALAYYQSECYQDSLQAYEAAIHWFAKTDNEKSNVLVAMAAVAYRMKEIEVTKNALFQSFDLQPPSVYGIFSLCAIGLLLGDSNLIQAATKEMLPYLKNENYFCSVIKLLCFTMILQGKIKQAQRIICKSIHEFPAHDQLWFLLSQILLQFSKEKSVVIDRCLSTLQAKMNWQTPDISINQIFSFRNVVHLANGCVKDCLRSAQKMLILNPNDMANWAGLLASIVMHDGNYSTTASKKWFINILNCIIKQADLIGDKNIHDWLCRYKSLMSLSINSNEVQNSVSKVTSTDQILQWLKDNNKSKQPKIDVLTRYVESNPEFSFGWQVLVRSLVATKKHSEAVEILELWKKSSPGSQTIANAILYNMALEQYENNKQKEWLKTAEKIESEMENMGESNGISFLIAKKYFLKKNQKKMKSKLEQLLMCSHHTNYEWTERAANNISNVIENKI